MMKISEQENFQNNSIYCILLQNPISIIYPSFINHPPAIFTRLLAEFMKHIWLQFELNVSKNYKRDVSNQKGSTHLRNIK